MRRTVPLAALLRLLAVSLVAGVAASAGLLELVTSELPVLELPAPVGLFGALCLAGALVVLAVRWLGGSCAVSLRALAPARRLAATRLRPAPLAAPAAGRAPPG